MWSHSGGGREGGRNRHIVPKETPIDSEGSQEGETGGGRAGNAERTAGRVTGGESGRGELGKTWGRAARPERRPLPIPRPGGREWLWGLGGGVLWGRKWGEARGVIAKTRQGASLPGNAPRAAVGGYNPDGVPGAGEEAAAGRRGPETSALSWERAPHPLPGGRAGEAGGGEGGSSLCPPSRPRRQGRLPGGQCPPRAPLRPGTRGRGGRRGGSRHHLASRSLSPCGVQGPWLGLDRPGRGWSVPCSQLSFCG